MMNRRHFLKSTSAASVAYSAWPIIPKRHQQYRTALIGSGWWGMNILREALESGEISAVAVCDVDRRHLKEAADEIENLTGSRPAEYVDYRELLHAENTDIAIVATPDHWHPLQTIAAVEAGAHVFVEKPVGHTINEGKAMVQAARDHERIVQVGTHRRVSPHNMSAMEFLKSGRAGKIGMVRAFVAYPGGPGQTVPDEEPPAELDWDMWLGPAPERPFNPRIHPRGFREFLDFANGQLGDWGIHWMDQILWWTEEKYPRKIHSSGGRHIRQDNTEAPDHQIATFEFESFTATWEHRLFAGNPAERHNIGCYFYGSEGTFHLGWRDGWTFYPNSRDREIIHEEPHLHTGDDHNIPELWNDFMDSIRNNRLPVCDIEIGHRSTNMSLLGMLSLKVGRSIEWDGENEIVVGDPEANEHLSRAYRGEWKYPQV